MRARPARSPLSCASAGMTKPTVNSKLNNQLRRNYRRSKFAGDLTHLAAEPSENPVEDALDDPKALRRTLFYEAARHVRHQVQPRTWEAFWRTAMLEVPAKEVAERLGMTVRAVYIAKCRVLSRIKKQIEARGRLIECHAE